MQGKLFENNFISGMDFEKVESLRQIYEWVQQHTEICHLYAQLLDEEEKAKLKEKIEFSLNRGKFLLETTFSESFHDHRSLMIPLSGVNRFSSPAHEPLALGKHEGFANSISNTSSPFKSELGASCNVKKMPMPSRTYLKKK
jgi:hypothetical protein